VERPVMAYRANRITYFGLANLICHTEIMTQFVIECPPPS
jgi:hypothetical protein